MEIILCDWVAEGIGNIPIAVFTDVVWILAWYENLDRLWVVGNLVLTCGIERVTQLGITEVGGRIAVHFVKNI